MSSAAFAVLNLLFVVAAVVVVVVCRVVVVVGLFYKRVSACFTHVSGYVLALCACRLARPQGSKSYFLIICRGRGSRGSNQRPGTFCGWPTHSTPLKKKTKESNEENRNY